MSAVACSLTCGARVLTAAVRACTLAYTKTAARKRQVLNAATIKHANEYTAHLKRQSSRVGYLMSQS